MEPISVGAATILQLMGIRRSRTYELIGSGDLPTVKIGRSTCISIKSLKRPS